MISALESLGSQLNFNTLANKIIPIRLKKGDSYICEFNFYTNENKIDIIIKKISNENLEELTNKYCWVGNLKGSSPQWHITSDTLSYVLNSLPILLEKVNDNSNLKIKLDNIVKQYYVNLNKKTYFNISGVKITFMDKEDTITSQLIQDFNSKKELNKFIIDKFVIQTDNLNSYFKDICLYTISIDDNLLSEDDEYIKILTDSMSPSDDNYSAGRCSICGKEGNVTDDTSKFSFKYYNKDKISFASDMSNFSKNFSICNECYQKIINAENYVSKNLKSYLGNSSIMIIPERIPFSHFNLDLDIELIFKLTNSIIKANAKELVDIASITNPTNSYILNIMFYQQSNNFFKIINIIPEIPEYRILKIMQNLNKVYEEFYDMFPYSDNWLNLNIQGFYRTMILSSSERKHKEAMNAVIDLFKFNKVEENKILKLYLEGIASYYHKNGRICEIEVILMNSYLKFLKEIGILSIKRENNYIKVGENYMKEDEFIENMGYSDEQESLFWIGYAIRNIGIVQFLNKITSNPMLEKINYQGMDFNALEKLVNQIDEKTKQYDIYGKDMGYALFKIHSIMSKYSLDGKKWPINDVSNVFLIMTGYSVASQLAASNKEEIKNGEENGN